MTKTPAKRLFDAAHDERASDQQLAALSHPLRMKTLGLLRAFGPSTATRIAERCNISSGLASYHLRQLAHAKLIEHVTSPSDAHGREKWWAPVTRSTYAEMTSDSPESEAVGSDFLRTVSETHRSATQHWLAVAHRWPREWVAASTMSDIWLRLTPAELHQLHADIESVLARYPRHDSDRDEPGEGDSTSMVSVQWQMFPNPEQEPPR